MRAVAVAVPDAAPPLQAVAVPDAVPLLQAVAMADAVPLLQAVAAADAEPVWQAVVPADAAPASEHAARSADVAGYYVLNFDHDGGLHLAPQQAPFYSS